MRATVKIVWDPKSTDSTRYLKLRVTYNRQPRIFTTDCDVKISQKEFENRRSANAIKAFTVAERMYSEAKQIIEKLGDSFTFEKFKTRYNVFLHKNTGATNNTLSSILQQYSISRGIAFKTIDTYRTAISALEQYKSVNIEEIDNSFVSNFISYLRTERHLQENTIRIYFRSYRAIYNWAIITDIIEHDNPFSHIPNLPLTSIRREKGAIDETAFSAFLSYSPKNNLEAFAKDFFLLSFYLYGANLGDIIKLKNENIQDNKLTYIRQKTSHRGGKISGVHLIEPAIMIIQKYGHLNPNKPSGYIFPYLSGEENNKEYDTKKRGLIKKINKGLRSICNTLGIEKITTYTARHTAATYLASGGLTPEQISHFLGHQSSKTTEIYLGSITTTTKQKAESIMNNYK